MEAKACSLCRVFPCHRGLLSHVWAECVYVRPGDTLNPTSMFLTVSLKSQRFRMTTGLTAYLPVSPELVPFHAMTVVEGDRAAV